MPWARADVEVQGRAQWTSNADGHAEPGIVLTARRTQPFVADATTGEGLRVFTCLTICSRIDHVSFDGERPLCGRSAVDAEGPLVAVLRLMLSRLTDVAAMSAFETERRLRSTPPFHLLGEAQAAARPARKCTRSA